MKFMKIYKLVLFTILVLFFTGCASQNITQNKAQSDDFSKFIKNKSDSLWFIPTDIAKKEAEDSYVRGLCYANDSNFANAALEFEYALKFDSSATIYMSLADAYLKLGFIDRALESAFKAYSIDSTKTEALEIVFSIFVYKRDIPSAEKVALKIYEKNPSLDNLLMLGDFYSFVDPKKGLEYYKKYDNLNPIPQVKTVINKLELLTGDTLSAIEGFKSLAISNSNPDYAWEYFDMSLITNQYANLYYCIDSLIGKYSLKDRTDFISSVVYRFYFTQSFINDSTTPFIKKTLHTVIDSSYNLGGIFIPSFFLAYNLKDTLLLESLLNKSIVLTDTISDIPLTAAQFYESIGKRDSSIVLLEKYIKKYPENPKYSVQLGYSYFLNNDWEKARYYLSKGYSLDTTNISLLISLGDVFDRLNKHDSAEHYYALAISKNSDDPLANNNYAYFLSQDTAKLQFAIELSKKAILAEPENAAYLDTFGWIMFKMNNLDTAFEYIEKAYKLDSTNYDIMEHLGDIYEKKGNIEQAIEYWEKSLEFNKNKKELIEKINKYRN